MESFENINILIKVKLFCEKNVFFSGKKLLFEKKYGFERKNKKLFVKKNKKKLLFNTNYKKNFGKQFLTRGA